MTEETKLNLLFAFAFGVYPWICLGLGYRLARTPQSSGPRSVRRTSYKLRVECGNCRRDRIQLRIPRETPAIGSIHTCPECGCRGKVHRWAIGRQPELDELFEVQDLQN